MQAGTSFFNNNTPTIVIRSLFDKYDKSRTGTLDATELNDLLQKDLGFKKDQANVYSLLLDKDGDQSISFEEFFDWLRSGERFEIINDQRRFKTLCKAVELFKTYDKDNNNSLSQDELKHLLDSLGYQEVDAERFFEYLDEHKNGKISFWELMKWLNWVPVEWKARTDHFEKQQPLMLTISANCIVFISYKC